MNIDCPICEEDIHVDGPWNAEEKIAEHMKTEHSKWELFKALIRSLFK